MIHWAPFSKPYISGSLLCFICKKEVEEGIFLYAKTETARDFLDMMFSQIYGVSLCFECKDKFEGECKKRDIGFKKLETNEERLDLIPDLRRHAHEVLSPPEDDELTR